MHYKCYSEKKIENYKRKLHKLARTYTDYCDHSGSNEAKQEDMMDEIIAHEQGLFIIRLFPYVNKYSILNLKNEFQTVLTFAKRALHFKGNIDHDLLYQHILRLRISNINFFQVY